MKSLTKALTVDIAFLNPYFEPYLFSLGTLVANWDDCKMVEKSRDCKENCLEYKIIYSICIAGQSPRCRVFHQPR